MTMDRDSSGRCAMRNRLALALVAAVGWSMSCGAAEAPVGESAGGAPVQAPLPPEAEAAHQDLVSDRRGGRWLDEAVFTEISPVTVPEIGIALPPDQAP